MTPLRAHSPIFAAGLLCTMVGCSTTSLMGSDETLDLPTTQAAQGDATPDDVLADLMAGNARFVDSQLTGIDLDGSRAAAATGQYPVAYVLSCVDSRVPVEMVFDQGIGDIFVGRVAGNFENTDQLGSMEFATAAAGAKVVFVLGHEACGAIKGAADDVELGNLTALLGELRPSVDAVEGHDADRSSGNSAFIADVVETNVRRTVADIRERSEVLRGLEAEGKIKIVGGVYDLDTGAVTLID